MFKSRGETDGACRRISSVPGANHHVKAMGIDVIRVVKLGL